MLRILTLLATVATVATLSGGANAHPPDISVLYGAPSHSQHGHGGYAQPRYERPVYRGNTYGTSAYVAPRYTAPRVRSGRSAYDGTPVYTKTYATPRYQPQAYRAPVQTTPTYSQPTYTAPRVESHTGQSVPRYGYRHRRGHTYGQGRNLYAERPLPQYRQRSYGPYSDIPLTESVNYGYSGGPTYGSDTTAVINGVRIYRERD